MTTNTLSVGENVPELLVGEFAEWDAWFTLRVPVDEETVDSLDSLTSALYTLLFFSDAGWSLEDIRATWLKLVESKDPASVLPDIDPAHDLLSTELVDGHLVLKLALVPLETIAHIESLYRAFQELAIHAHVDFSTHDMSEAFSSAIWGAKLFATDLDIPW